jgi:hypothetical protein
VERERKRERERERERKFTRLGKAQLSLSKIYERILHRPQFPVFDNAAARILISGSYNL